MMRLALSIVLVAGAVSAQGLTPACSTSVRSGVGPLTVQFTDLSTTNDPNGVVGWAWDFDGDGIPDSNFQNPTFTYTTIGSYDVTLTVVDTINAPQTITKTAAVLVGTIPATYSFHQSSVCDSSVGHVTLTGQGGDLPQVGSTFSAEIAGMPASTVALMVTGFNDAMSGPFPLPLDLTPFGLNGCMGNIEAFDTSLVFGNAGGIGIWSVPIPADLSFSGLQFYNQAFVVDPASATAVGAVMSDSAVGVIGV